MTHLHYVAASHANPAATEELSAESADVGVQDSDAAAPLHRGAAPNESPAVVGVLPAADADRAAHTAVGSTPLHHAATSYENPAGYERWRTPLHRATTPTLLNTVVAAGTQVDAQGCARE